MNDDNNDLHHKTAMLLFNDETKLHQLLKSLNTFIYGNRCPPVRQFNASELITNNMTREQMEQACHVLPLLTYHIKETINKNQTQSSSASLVHKTPVVAPTIQRASLILVFGKSHQINIDELKDISKIDATHRQILKGYEWFWHGEQKQVPILSNEDQGSMFWIRIDYSGGVINVNQQVKTYLQVTDLLDRLVNNEIELNLIKTGGPFNYECLSQKGFLKA